ncbi:MAG: DUF1285 domain-containing protein [Smithella sp.]|jgi:hypothetical protein|nr:DUF1285 domain-containing protein [Smithella sp.]
MTDKDIAIDKEGIWYYRGAHMFRKDILCIFFEHLKIDEDGKYFIELNGEICYLDVEDTAFVVTAVYEEDQILILLSDDSLEPLALSSLRVGKDNVMYCTIKGGRFVARFTRKAYYQLAQMIETDGTENSFFIRFDGCKYYITTNNQ